jgi:hypothetical protein
MVATFWEKALRQIRLSNIIAETLVNQSKRFFINSVYNSVSIKLLNSFIESNGFGLL